MYSTDGRRPLSFKELKDFILSEKNELPGMGREALWGLESLVWGPRIGSAWCFPPVRSWQWPTWPHT